MLSSLHEFWDPALIFQEEEWEEEVITQEVQSPPIEPFTKNSEEGDTDEFEYGRVDDIDESSEPEITKPAVELDIIV